MSIGTLVFLTFIITVAAIMLGEAAMTWVLRKIIWRGIQSSIVDKSDAEAMLGRWHKGWRLWFLRSSSFVIIATLLWSAIPRPQAAGKWTAAKAAHRVIDKGVNAVKKRIPGDGANSQKIKDELDRGAGKAKSLTTPK